MLIDTINYRAAHVLPELNCESLNKEAKGRRVDPMGSRDKRIKVADRFI